ncbi:MAG: 2'-5' RNA ligase family protein [Elainella sp. C42_A2020_010]|nr:2'-5' RNA ligase family protein [Elainella sp. C42_A2020_010]RNJ67629.1 MAG: 2'-5' RNA ligase family protein [Leptolyngbya sp. IPPAS B-1204]
MSSAPPLVLTLKLDAILFSGLNQLRQQHFPPERSFLPAHVTLFHHLPGEQEVIIQQDLQTLCSQTATLSLRLQRLRCLGRGVAVEIDCPELVQLRTRLAQAWSIWLTPQDRQPYRPHITIQNKVTPDAARQLYAQLNQTWQPLNGQGEGLLLWYYRNGPWEKVAEFSFLF